MVYFSDSFNLKRNRKMNEDGEGDNDKYMELGPPHFNQTTHTFNTDMLQEFLFTMAHANNNLVQNPNRFSVKIKTSCYLRSFYYLKKNSKGIFQA